ncbi:hypothetical protein [Orrella sp. 11846]|uniref:hypothetical protein n=1 Tax=Orrella sp. 11846 TaxID=3409913 RepID=UPI003B58F73C
MKQLVRLSFLSALLALFSGCTLFDAMNFHSSSSHQRQSRSMQCTLSPASCDYKGQYEPGEARYAELEARRLNKLEIARIQNLNL